VSDLCVCGICNGCNIVMIGIIGWMNERVDGDGG
jgi:hypothetical protein